MSIRYWDASKGHGLNKVLYQVEPLELKINPHLMFQKICSEIHDEFGTGYVPEDNFNILGKKPKGRRIVGKVEGGRSTTIEKLIEIGGQEFKINVKGSSARFDGKDEFSNRYFPIERIEDTVQRKNAQKLFDQKCFVDVIYDVIAISHTPYGGQDYDWSIDALDTSDGVFSKTLGMYICPVLMASRISPEDVVRCNPREGYEELKYVGAYGQDIRLVPSNVRVKPVYSDIGIHDLDDELMSEMESIDEFTENLISSFVQATCLPFNTMKAEDDGRSAYYYGLVTPTKDGVIAGNGTLYFLIWKAFSTKPRLAEVIFGTTYAELNLIWMH